MKSTYQENQRERSTNLIENSELFEGVLGGRKFFGKERKFVLSDEEKNIFKPLRSDVIDYFKNNRISWWGGKKTNRTCFIITNCVYKSFVFYPK